MDTIALIIILAVLQFAVFTSLTGRARANENVKAPATTGGETFERWFRVQQNTMEHLVAFVPAIYLCAVYTNATVAIVGGVLYLVGRCLYAYTYVKDPQTRGLGMILSFLPILMMILAALGGVLMTVVG